MCPVGNHILYQRFSQQHNLDATPPFNPFLIQAQHHPFNPPSVLQASPPITPVCSLQRCHPVVLPSNHQCNQQTFLLFILLNNQPYNQPISLPVIPPSSRRAYLPLFLPCSPPVIPLANQAGFHPRLPLRNPRFHLRIYHLLSTIRCLLLSPHVNHLEFHLGNLLCSPSLIQQDHRVPFQVINLASNLRHIRRDSLSFDLPLHQALSHLSNPLYNHSIIQLIYQAINHHRIQHLYHLQILPRYHRINRLPPPLFLHPVNPSEDQASYLQHSPHRILLDNRP